MSRRTLPEDDDPLTFEGVMEMTESQLLSVVESRNLPIENEDWDDLVELREAVAEEEGLRPS